jgi:hypothetical protein
MFMVALTSLLDRLLNLWPLCLRAFCFSLDSGSALFTKHRMFKTSFPFVSGTWMFVAMVVVNSCHLLRHCRSHGENKGCDCFDCLDACKFDCCCRFFLGCRKTKSFRHQRCLVEVHFAVDSANCVGFSSPTLSHNRTCMQACWRQSLLSMGSCRQLKTSSSRHLACH